MAFRVLLVYAMNVITSSKGVNKMGKRGMLNLVVNFIVVIAIMVSVLAFDKDSQRYFAKTTCNYDIDTLIVGRGGGSIEDLWAYNEEIVAKAIYECPIPVISAVGHEIDFTIADFVADLRAPTPTGAAEMAVPNMSDLLNLITQYKLRSTNIINTKIKNYQNVLDKLKSSYVLTNPLNIYEIKEQKVSDLIDRLNNYITNKIEINKTKYEHLRNNRILCNPEEMFKEKYHKYNLILNKLELLNPLNILSKGYSVVSKDDEIIKDSDRLKVGDNINIRLSKGKINAKVEGIE